MKARHTIWAQEATQAHAADHAPMPFRYAEADPEDLQRALQQARKLPMADRLELLARVMKEGDRVRLAKSLGVPPEACGGAMVGMAPARGPVVEITTTSIIDDGKGGTRAVHSGYRCRSAMRAEDVLDRIKGLTPGQIEAGRRYAAITEAVASGGMKCSAAVMVATGGGVSARDFMDVYADQADRLRRMHRQIGTGIGMPVRRVRPSVRGVQATSIRDRALVDMVCLGGLALAPVLQRHGWVKTGRSVAALATALGLVLERLRLC